MVKWRYAVMLPPDVKRLADDVRGGLSFSDVVELALRDYAERNPRVPTAVRERIATERVGRGISVMLIGVALLTIFLV